MTGAATERKGKGRQRLRWYVFGPLVGAAAFAAFGLACAMLLERQVPPASTIEVLTIACVFAGAAAGGAAAAKRRGGGAIEAGLACGLTLAAVVVVAALAAPGEGPVTASCLRFVIAALAGGGFGGALCLNRGKSKRRKSRLGRKYY